MAKVTIRIKHVSWRDGRPRFEPGPVLRKLGYKHGEDLKGLDGKWMTAEQARDWAERRDAEISAKRQAQKNGARLRPVKRGVVYTLEDLFEDFWKSPKVAGGAEAKGKRKARKTLSPETVKDYKAKANALASFDPDLWGSGIAALSPPILYGLYERLWEGRGHHMANGIMAVVRLALSYAVRKGKLIANPAKGLEMETPAPRLVVGTIKEMETLVLAADLIGHPMIGHAIMLGLFTGQRQADRLALMDAGNTETGWRRFRQSKTGAVVEVPEAPQLTVRLAAAREWRERQDVKVANVIVHPGTLQAYDRFAYGKAFRLVREAAVDGIRKIPEAESLKVQSTPECAQSEEWLLKPCPSLKDFRDQDLRDTAVTWLARSGCTISEIRSITGHDEASVYQILKHYVGVDREMAGNAIAKMVTYLEAKGSAL